MLPLSKMALALAVAMAGACIMVASQSVFAASAVNGLPKSDISRGQRYDPALVKNRTGVQAVSMCIRAAQNEAETRGHIMGIDIQSVAEVKGGFDIHGSIMVKPVPPGRIVTADFQCITAGDVLAKLTISKWHTPA